MQGFYVCPFIHVPSSETGPRCSSPVDSELSSSDGTKLNQNRKLVHVYFIILHDNGRKGCFKISLLKLKLCPNFHSFYEIHSLIYFLLICLKRACGVCVWQEKPPWWRPTALPPTAQTATRKKARKSLPPVRQSPWKP